MVQDIIKKENPDRKVWVFLMPDHSPVLRSLWAALGQTLRTALSRNWKWSGRCLDWVNSNMIPSLL